MIHAKALIDYQKIYDMGYSIVMHYLTEFKYASYSGIVAVLLARKILRTAYGGRFSRRSIFVSPLLYVLFAVAVSVGTRVISILIAAVAFALGIYVSFHTSRSVIFFTKNDTTYYKRPVWVVSIWSIAFIGRLTVLFFFPNFDGDLFSILLFFASGLIVGEAANIAWKQKQAMKKTKHWRLRLPKPAKKKASNSQQR